MYISTCRHQLDKQGLAFLTPDERYDYAVSQINAGDFEEAANQLKGILSDDPTRRLRLLWPGRCSIRSPARRRIAWTAWRRPSN